MAAVFVFGHAPMSSSKKDETLPDGPVITTLQYGFDKSLKTC